MPGCRLDQWCFTASTGTYDVDQQPGTRFGVDLVAQCARLCGFARAVIRRDLRHLPGFPEAGPARGVGGARHPRRGGGDHTSTRAEVGRIAAPRSFGEQMAVPGERRRYATTAEPGWQARCEESGRAAAARAPLSLAAR